MSTEHEFITRRGRASPAAAPCPTARRPPATSCPQFEERTAYGFKRQDPYTKLFEDRIIFLGVQVDDASADDIMAQLLVLESQDPDRDITLYINSPGGSFTAHDGDLRHDAVHQAADRDGVPGPGRLGRRRAALGRHARASGSRCPTRAC